MGRKQWKNTPASDTGDTINFLVNLVFPKEHRQRPNARLSVHEGHTFFTWDFSPGFSRFTRRRSDITYSIESCRCVTEYAMPCIRRNWQHFGSQNVAKLVLDMSVLLDPQTTKLEVGAFCDTWHANRKSHMVHRWSVYNLLATIKPKCRGSNLDSEEKKKKTSLRRPGRSLLGRWVLSPSAVEKKKRNSCVDHESVVNMTTRVPSKYVAISKKWNASKNSSWAVGTWPEFWLFIYRSSRMSPKI